VSVASRAIDDPEWSSLDIVGDLSRVDRPTRVTLSPLASADADALVVAMNGRYGLPRVPVQVPAECLASLERYQLVEVSGLYAPSHCEYPDFEMVSLRIDRRVHAPLSPGRRYRVVGFIEPAPKGPCVGYSGARLRAVDVHLVDA
jgi:hypothetical protein